MENQANIFKSLLLSCSCLFLFHLNASPIEYDLLETPSTHLDNDDDDISEDPSFDEDQNNAEDEPKSWKDADTSSAQVIKSNYEFTPAAKDKNISHRYQIDFLQTKIDVGGWLELQGNDFLNSPVPGKQKVIRAARLYFDSISRDLIEFMIMIQGDKGRLGLHYLYLDVLKPHYFRIRAGLFNKPFSMEALYSIRYLWMINRSLGTINYITIRDFGGEIHGTFLEDRFEYGIALFNGNGTNLASNPNKDFCARLEYRPYAHQKESLYHNLRLGISFTTCEQKNHLTGTSFKTGYGTPFLSWNSPHIKAKTNKMLCGGDTEWLIGPTALRGEFLIVNWDKVSTPTTSVPFTGYSWYIESGYILTGEDQRHNLPLIPKNNFNFQHGGGAVEVTARYEAFQADKKVIQAGLATGTSYVSGFTLGLNYYFNPFVLIRFNWQESYFHKTIMVKNRPIRDESVLSGILQGEF